MGVLSTSTTLTSLNTSSAPHCGTPGPCGSSVAPLTPGSTRNPISPLSRPRENLTNPCSGHSQSQVPRTPTPAPYFKSPSFQDYKSYSSAPRPRHHEPVYAVQLSPPLPSYPKCSHGPNISSSGLYLGGPNFSMSQPQSGFPSCSTESHLGGPNFSLSQPRPGFPSCFTESHLGGPNFSLSQPRSDFPSCSTESHLGGPNFSRSQRWSGFPSCSTESHPLYSLAGVHSYRQGIITVLFNIRIYNKINFFH